MKHDAYGIYGSGSSAGSLARPLQSPVAARPGLSNLQWQLGPASPISGGSSARPLQSPVAARPGLSNLQWQLETLLRMFDLLFRIVERIRIHSRLVGIRILSTWPLDYLPLAEKILYIQEVLTHYIQLL